MTGFFPIAMFALPAAALAIYQGRPPPKAKKAVGGLMASGGAHGVPHRGDRAHRVRLHVRRLAAVRRARRAHRHVDGAGERLEIRDGFGFSAGLFDFLLNWNIATRPALLIVMGLGYAVVYYVLFRFVIRRWNLRTPYQEDDADDAAN